jgi:hypothetical protein
MMYPLRRGRSEPGVGRGGDSSEVEAESEPWGRVRRRPSSEVEVEVESEPWGRARRSPSSEVEVESEPWGRARRSPSSEVEVESEPRGSGEAELPMAPEVGLGGCQPHSVEWHSSRSRAGGAVFLSGRSVERQSDCGHFGPVD